MNKQKNGFTLIELIVVVAVISFLASLVVASLSTARLKARTTHRIADLNQIRSALEIYYSTNGSYPSTGGVFKSECATWGGLAANDVIQGMVPTYMSSFPSDPAMNKIANSSCYVYVSNGVDYALLDYAVSDPGFSYFSNQTLIDPARDNGLDTCVVDGLTPFSWKVSSVGAACW